MEPPSFDGGNFEGNFNPNSVPQKASMEPPSFDGGNPPTPALMQPMIRRFNGAAVFRRRKHPYAAAAPGLWTGFNGAAVFRRRKLGRHPALEACGDLELQWSRRLSTAETWPISSDGVSSKSWASMEPPSFDGGNFFRNAAPSATTCSLQWSRRLSTAETRGE